MVMPRYAAKRDRNEPDVVKAAQLLGWYMVKLHQPVDWLGLYRGVWHVIEVKRPECEGWVSEYTKTQKKFIAEVTEKGGQILTWRTVDDILEFIERAKR